MNTVSPTAAAGDLAALAEGDVTRLRDRLVVECAHHAARANEGRAAVAELAGRNDVQSHFEREFAEVAIRRSNEAVIDIFNALSRIDAGVYGRCVHCGGLIPPDRLESNPRARCCPSCPDATERQHHTGAARLR